MALIKEVLESQIKTAFKRLYTAKANTPEQSIEQLSKDLTEAIDAYIKSATIIIPPGQESKGTNAIGQTVSSTVTINSAVYTATGKTSKTGVVNTKTTTNSPAAKIS
jgi:hypothetical protein